MSYLDKLLQGKEVEWKTLREVVLHTSNIRWKDANKSYRYIDLTSVSREQNAIIETTEITKDNAPSRAQKLVLKDDVIFATTRPTQQRLCLINEEYSNEVASTGYCVLRANKNVILPKWIFYWISSKEFKKFVEENQSGSAYPAIPDIKVKEFQIPIPPLSVQKEIVRILDKFTELTAELTAELIARKKQYKYYREGLLSFETTKETRDVQWKTLGEVGAFIRGGGLQKKDFTEKGVGCIHYGQIYTHYGTYTTKTKSFVSEEFAKKARIAKPGDLIIATTSENDEDLCKAVAWVGNEDIAVSSDACFYQHKMVPKYVAYFFQTEQFQTQKRPFITGAKVRRVNANDLAKIRIPIPSLKEQARIVAILDKFDTLTTSISEGLPKEIELRQKQYEYYRDLLLTFPSTPADPEPTKKSTKKTTAKK